MVKGMLAGGGMYELVSLSSTAAIVTNADAVSVTYVSVSSHVLSALMG